MPPILIYHSIAYYSAYLTIVIVVSWCLRRVFRWIRRALEGMAWAERPFGSRYLQLSGYS